jgi:outer membrane receptor for ferric coprogen and ferric-rhodotorulic acid
VSPTGRVTVGQEAYATASLMARYALTSKSTLSINVNNLFDKRYYVMTGFYNQALYGEPRNVMVTFNYKLYWRGLPEIHCYHTRFLCGR